MFIIVEFEKFKVIIKLAGYIGKIIKGDTITTEVSAKVIASNI